MASSASGGMTAPSLRLASSTPLSSTSSSQGTSDGTVLSRSSTQPSSSSQSNTSSSNGHGHVERWHPPVGSSARPAAVTLEDVQSLTLFFINEYTTARANGHHPEVKAISDRVHALFGADNIFSLIDNHHGQYCTSYPPQLVVIEAETTGKYARDTNQRAVNEIGELKPFFHQSRFNRVHGRFIMPTIMVRNKNVCRSATLSMQFESIFNSVHAKTKEIIGGLYDSYIGSALPSRLPPASTAVLSGMESQRAADEKLLQLLGVKYIADLMVEVKKKKLGLHISSSEKAESERYSKFTISIVPYPGCEFFTLYKANRWNGVGLHFDWSQSFVNAELSLGVDDADIGADVEAEAERKAKERANRRRRRFEHRKQLAIQAQADVAAAAAAASAAASTALVDQSESSHALAGAGANPSPSSSPILSASPPDMSPPSMDDLVDPLADDDRRSKTKAWLTKTSMSSSAPALATIVSGAPVVAQAITTSNSSEPVHVHVEPSSSNVRVVIAPTERKVEEKGPLSRASSIGSTNGDGVMVPSSNGTSNGMSNSTGALPLSGSGVNSVTAGAVARASRWSVYKSWDVVRLTKNYLWLMLSHISDPQSSSGLLVHCISGWDRTPLFVSLLRLTLWADGEIHRSLSPSQMLYMTIAYDWMLFGHHLSNRLGKGEDVFYFCFDFLQYITHHCYSLKAVTSSRRGKNGQVEKKEDKHTAQQRKINALIGKIRVLLDTPPASPQLKSAGSGSSSTNGSPVLLPSQSPSTTRNGSGDTSSTTTKRVPVHNGNGPATSMGNSNDRMNGRPSPPLGPSRMINGLAGGRASPSEEKVPPGVAFIRREHSGSNLGGLIPSGRSVGETSGRWIPGGMNGDSNDTNGTSSNSGRHNGLVVSASHDEVGHGALSVDDTYFATTPDRKESLDLRRAKFGIAAASGTTNGTSVSTSSSLATTSSSTLFTKDTTVIPSSSPPSGPSGLGALLKQQRTQSADNAVNSSSSSSTSSVTSASSSSSTSAIVVTSVGRTAVTSSTPPTATSSSSSLSSSPHIVKYHPSAARSSPPNPSSLLAAKPPSVPSSSTTSSSATRTPLRVDSSSPFASPPPFASHHGVMTTAEPSPSHSPFDSPRIPGGTTGVPSLPRPRSDSLSSESGFVDDFTPPRETSKPVAIGRPIPPTINGHGSVGSHRSTTAAVPMSISSKQSSSSSSSMAHHSRRTSARMDDDDLCGSNPVDVPSQLRGYGTSTTNNQRSNGRPSINRVGSSSLSTSWQDVNYLGRSSSGNNLQSLVGSIPACTCGGMSICRACSTSSVGSITSSSQYNQSATTSLHWDPNVTQTLTIGHMTGGSFGGSYNATTLPSSTALIRHPSQSSPLSSPTLRPVAGSTSPSFLSYTAAAIAHGVPQQQQRNTSSAASSPLLLSSLPVMVPALTLTDAATVTPTVSVGSTTSTTIPMSAPTSVSSLPVDPIRQRFNDLLSGEDVACLSPIRTLKSLRQILQDLRTRADPTYVPMKYGGRHRGERLMEVRRLFFAAYHHVLPHTVLPPLPTATATTASSTNNNVLPSASSPIMSPTPSPPSSPSFNPLPLAAAVSVPSMTTSAAATPPASVPVRSTSSSTLADGAAGCGVAATIRQSAGSSSSDRKSNVEGSPAKPTGWFGWMPGLT